MNKKKNHNSIVFLTTLSVYLGLVLAGGVTPTVLAQAALTRDFDIKNEIVFEDDLDKKPDEDFENFRKFKFVEAIAAFFDDLGKLESIDKFDFNKDFNFSQEILFNKDRPSIIYSNYSNRWIKTAAEPIILYSKVILPKCVDITLCEDYKIEIKGNSKEFLLSLKFSKSNSETAKNYAETLNEIFVSQKLESKNNSAVLIYENTQATSENNQVFIVTRLPRASLDALLAEKDAR